METQNISASSSSENIERISKVTCYGRKDNYLRVHIPQEVINCYNIDKNSSLIWRVAGNRILVEVI